MTNLKVSGEESLSKETQSVDRGKANNKGWEDCNRGEPSPPVDLEREARRWCYQRP